jgi:hypothetical protein
MPAHSATSCLDPDAVEFVFETFFTDDIDFLVLGKAENTGDVKRSSICRAEYFILEINKTDVLAELQPSGGKKGKSDLVSLEAELVEFLLEFSAALCGVVCYKDEGLAELAEMLERCCDALDDLVAVPDHVPL